MRSSETGRAFESLIHRNWKTALFDQGTKDWTEHWFLDGRKAELKNTDHGMEFYAGPTFGDDSCHAVLWTKDSFAGDVKIEYDFTRLDSEHRCVNILYIQATGSGKEPYGTDIAEWSHLRDVPAMGMYFNHMNTYHISYAAFGNTDEKDIGYIRARRYTASGLDGTEFGPDYDPTGYFDTGVTHKMTFIKSGDHLYLHVANEEREQLCHWHNRDFPSIFSGRIGLRQMFTRAARYENIRVSTFKED